MVADKNPYSSNVHYRRSIRLQHYDYSQAGLYFITICCQNRVCYFGDISNGEMLLNEAGTMVANQWQELPNRFPTVVLQEYQVMPNHFHGILQIQTGQTQGIAPTVGDMVGAFKSIVTVEYIRGVKNLGWSAFKGRLWQRNYYEHVIRNEASHLKIAEYIINNPTQWDDDQLNPKNPWQEASKP
jgi:REP element-mobilizing transposase RayT